MNENTDEDYTALDAIVNAPCVKCMHARGDHLVHANGNSGCSLCGNCSYTPWSPGGWEDDTAKQYGYDLTNALRHLKGMTLREMANRIKGMNGKTGRYTDFGKAHAPLYALLKEVEAMSSGEELLATGNDAKTVLNRIGDLIRTRLLEAAMFGFMTVAPATAGGISVVPSTEKKKRWTGYCRKCHHLHFTYGARICRTGSGCGCTYKPRRPRS